MPRVQKPTNRLLLTGAKASAPLDPLQAGMPALDAIHDDKAILKKKGQTYRILKTTETDSYEKTPTAVALTKVLKGAKAPDPTAIATAVKGKPPTTENFAGSDRKAAKLSIASAPMQNYPDVSSLIATLPSVDDMVKLNIPTDPTSNRVSQEERNLHVTGFLFASSREADNDFHLIVGDAPNAPQEMYMTMEVSGLPPANSPAFTQLNAARNSFKQLAGCRISLLSAANSGSSRRLAVFRRNALHRPGSRPAELEEPHANHLRGSPRHKH